MKNLLSISIFFTCITVHLSAQVIHVPDDKPKIQSAIDGAEDGDTVLVAEGTYLENINFKGKAITVASHFILDGDTAHISRTIINGSQPENPDAASVVLLMSGEDSTSVIVGFTLTGGGGFYTPEVSTLAGGGIFSFESGGKIEFNIITGNHIETKDVDTEMGSGPGICLVSIPENKTAIIRNNRIHHNTGISASNFYTGGINYVDGSAQKTGSLLIEYNSIHNNTIETRYHHASGAGIGISLRLPATGNIIIRNNRVFGNKATEGPYDFYKYQGAGMHVWYSDFGGFTSDPNPCPVIYNNLFYNNLLSSKNTSDKTASAIRIINFDKSARVGQPRNTPVEIANQPIFYNNTVITNSDADQPALAVMDAHPILFNNIFWDGSSSDQIDNGIYYETTQLSNWYNNELVAHYNNIPGGWGGEENIDVDPAFITDSFGLAAGSHCIGAGINSIEVANEWYHAPGNDLFDNVRPDPVDNMVDLGAIETPYEGTGVEELIKAKVSIYPNPTTSILTIETGNSDLKNIEIATLNGQIVFRKKMHKATDQIDLVFFKPGVYFVTIRSNDMITTRKIIKL